MSRSGTTAAPGPAAAAASLSLTSVSGKLFDTWGNIIKLLPTAAVFVFLFVNHLVTNNGECGVILRKAFECLLIGVCCFFCAFACFTDSYRDRIGMVHYGIATVSGLWPPPVLDSVNVSTYKLKFADFVHAIFSVFMFAAFALMESDTVKCLYPKLGFANKIMLKVVPPAIGAVCGLVFSKFPYTRHGIGFPPIRQDDNHSNS